MSFGFPGYRQQCFITGLANINWLHVTSGLWSIHFFQFNSIPIQVGLRIFQFNSIRIQIRFRIFQFNSISIHFLSFPIQFNWNFMHRDKQMNKITGWNKFYWIVPWGPIDFRSAWFRYWANGMALKGQQAITWNNADSLTHTCGTRRRWVDVQIFRIIIISDAGAQIKICWNVLMEFWGTIFMYLV